MSLPDARLLGLAGNYALAQVEGRRFPGLLIQGDSLHSLQGVVRELQNLAQTDDTELAEETLAEVAEVIDGMVDTYERMMREKGLDLPYFPS